LNKISYLRFVVLATPGPARKRVRRRLRQLLCAPDQQKKAGMLTNERCADAIEAATTIQRFSDSTIQEDVSHDPEN
jgi:hypothetical protein